MSDDDKLSQRYRELPREEPPRALDDAILTASRRAVQRRRRYVPLATAAVLALAVAVTLHVQRDRPGEEIDAVAPAMNVQEAPKAEAPPAKPSPRADAAPRAERREPQPFSGAPGRDPFSNRDFASPARAPAAAPAAEEERKQVGEMAAQSAGARASRDEPARAQSQLARAAIAASPEAQLERIAQLRAAGRHEEADKALAEFRKRYPDYRLSDETKAKVERRQ